jgi:hypothetical protein
MIAADIFIRKTLVYSRHKPRPACILPVSTPAAIQTYLLLLLLPVDMAPRRPKQHITGPSPTSNTSDKKASRSSAIKLKY